MRVKASPDAAVTRLHASTRRPDIGGTVPYDSSLLRHCACCRNQHNGGNYKNILPHSLSSSFCTPDMHGLTPGNQVGFCPTTFQLLCASGPGASGAGASGLFAASASRVTPFVTSFAACHHAVRGVLCGALDAVPSRSSGPQHPTLSAPWLALRGQTRPLVPKGKKPFGAKSVPI